MLEKIREFRRNGKKFEKVLSRVMKSIKQAKIPKAKLIKKRFRGYERLEEPGYRIIKTYKYRDYAEICIRLYGSMERSYNRLIETLADNNITWEPKYASDSILVILAKNN